MTLVRIGDMARLGGVSIRMLRHYHELQLLCPAVVEPSSGYRWYDLDQLPTLRRIVSWREVGLGLEDIATLLDRATAAETATALLGRHREVLRSEADGARRRLAQFEQIMDEGAPGEPKSTGAADAAAPMQLKEIPGRLVAQLTDHAESWAPTDIGPVIQPLYPELTARMEAAGVAISGPSTAWYEDAADGRIAVHATLTIAERPPADPEELGFEVIELPRVELAACAIHRGSMDDCDDTYELLLTQIEHAGFVPTTYGRELDIECGPGTDWIVELQIPIASAT